MKKHILIISLTFLFSIVFYSSSRAQFHSEAPITISESGEILTDMIYVKFKPNDLIVLPMGEIETDGNSISENYPVVKRIFVDYCEEWDLSLNELKLIKAIPQAKEDDTLYVDNTGNIRTLPNLAKVYIIRFPKPVNIEAIMSGLKTFTEVEYTHGPVQWVDCTETPNDPKYSDGSQWYLNTIQAPGAWGITKGSSNIKIALIENGVELTHTDLQSKIVGGDGNPNGVQTPHGTNVAGIAGAVTNNGTGIASLGWNISLLTYQPYIDQNLSIVAQKII
ncbi:MAG: S8 family serine peptidase [Ignavibacteria bacterium]|nr:S8 family serine peptidase [Ignavibacteria bacterium]